MTDAFNRDEHNQELSRRVKNAIANDSTLDFWHELHNKGIALEEAQLLQLIRAKKIKDPNTPDHVPEQPGKRIEDQFPKYLRTTTAQKSADKHIDVKNADSIQETVLSKMEYDSSKVHHENNRVIQKKDWAPKSTMKHTVEFIEWINSINNNSFSKMMDYKPFLLYCEQAANWLSDTTDIDDFEEPEDKRRYAYNEFARSDENSLYWLDKYLKLQDGLDPTIAKDDFVDDDDSYISAPVHKVIAYMFDCGYSSCTGKPRQIAATSTYGGLAIKKIIFTKNTFVKFITMDVDKGEEIFKDKMKYPYSQLPRWMKTNIHNETSRLINLMDKPQKGDISGPNSRIKVVAPTVAAINGGSPQVVMVDEAGYIPIITKMIKEARPTLFARDKVNGGMKMKRQIIIWSTGGEMDKGGKAFEDEYYSYLDGWNAGNYSIGIIPIFFDWTTRPGITQEHYDSEREVYRSGNGDNFKGLNEEERLNQFRQHYPTTIEDMFLTSEKTLMTGSWTSDQLDRITKARDIVQYGKFEPIFNFQKPIENTDVPYEIIGSNFVPCHESEIHNAAVIIISQPKGNFINRYYQGTDPIATDNGYSNMASVIWDVWYNAPAALVNYRSNDHHETFLQCMLLNMYYDTRRDNSVKELVEMNIAVTYVDYLKGKGKDHHLVYNTELPMHYRGGKAIRYGIDNHGNRTRAIIAELKTVLINFGENIYIREVFIQIRHFICQISTSGIEKWGTKDPEKYHDDVLYGLVFAYICSVTFPFRIAKEIKSDTRTTRTILKLVQDENGNQTRMPVEVPI